MAKNNAPEVKEEQKVLTKYDRKMAARKEKEIMDKKSEKKFKVISGISIFVVVLFIVAAIATPIYLKQKNMKDIYVVVGDREVSGLEYDYYYNAVVNSFLTSYGSYLPYLGLDTSVDYSEQAFSESMTWEDEFNRMAVEQMRQIFALSADAKKNGFEYDVEPQFQEHQERMKEAASASEVSLSEYYKTSFGENATVSNMEPIIKEGIMVSAYQDSLIQKNLPSDEEVSAYYNENISDYDHVDYRSFVFTASATATSSAEEVENAMNELKTSADAFVSERAGGADFEELCIKYASENAKANYENETTEYSLSTQKYKSDVPSDIAEWLFDSARKEGDITVIKSATYNQYYVVEFSKRYKAEDADENISNYLSSVIVSEQIAALTEEFPINDIHGNFKYLTAE
ncbi:MAG: peptidyl-prolyl cis-trans isomerase [Lachnospiraceae bacterium]|nr:peptidyl-prolyl cis-trans isomerase [Lachnospiraceae bacterium]